MTSRIVNLPEQRHLKQKLINISIYTFILPSVNSPAFCLVSCQNVLFQTDAFNCSFNGMGFFKSLLFLFLLFPIVSLIII